MGSGLVDVRVRTLAGAELQFSLADTNVAKEVKSLIKAEWGIPVSEQKLLLMGSILADSDQLGSIVDDETADIVCMRGAAFNFEKSLAHRKMLVSSDNAKITHGGGSDYQAAFLSDILNSDGCYKVKFKLEDASGRNFEEMYVGVAPDAERNWSNLKGAYLNRLGIYVDAFGCSGWRPKANKSYLFQVFQAEAHARRCKLDKERARIFRQAEDIQMEFDWSDSSCNFEQAGDAYLKTCEEAMNKARTEFEEFEKIFNSESPSAEFVLEINMPERLMLFWNTSGALIETLELPHLQAEPIRLCATLAYPQQSVSIMDDD